MKREKRTLVPQKSENTSRERVMPVKPDRYNVAKTAPLAKLFKDETHYKFDESVSSVSEQTREEYHKNLQGWHAPKKEKESSSQKKYSAGHGYNIGHVNRSPKTVFSEKDDLLEKKENTQEKISDVNKKKDIEIKQLKETYSPSLEKIKKESSLLLERNNSIKNFNISEFSQKIEEIKLMFVADFTTQKKNEISLQVQNDLHALALSNGEEIQEVDLSQYYDELLGQVYVLLEKFPEFSGEFSHALEITNNEEFSESLKNISEVISELSEEEQKSSGEIIDLEDAKSDLKSAYNEELKSITEKYTTEKSAITEKFSEEKKQMLQNWEFRNRESLKNIFSDSEPKMLTGSKEEKERMEKRKEEFAPLFAEFKKVFPEKFEKVYGEKREEIKSDKSLEPVNEALEIDLVADDKQSLESKECLKSITALREEIFPQNEITGYNTTEWSNEDTVGASEVFVYKKFARIKIELIDNKYHISFGKNKPYKTASSEKCKELLRKAKNIADTSVKKKKEKDLGNGTVPLKEERKNPDIMPVDDERNDSTRIVHEENELLSESIGIGFEVHDRESLYIPVGDLSGSYTRLEEVLGEMNVLDEEGNWNAGTTVINFTGDILGDREKESFKILERLYDLREQAREKGGDILITAGNHELLAFLFFLGVDQEYALRNCARNAQGIGLLEFLDLIETDEIKEKLKNTPWIKDTDENNEEIKKNIKKIVRYFSEKGGLESGEVKDSMRILQYRTLFLENSSLFEGVLEKFQQQYPKVLKMIGDMQLVQYFNNSLTPHTDPVNKMIEKIVEDKGVEKSNTDFQQYMKELLSGDTSHKKEFIDLCNIFLDTGNRHHINGVPTEENIKQLKEIYPNLQNIFHGHTKDKKNATVSGVEMTSFDTSDVKQSFEVIDYEGVDKVSVQKIVDAVFPGVDIKEGETLLTIPYLRGKSPVYISLERSSIYIGRKTITFDSRNLETQLAKEKGKIQQERLKDSFYGILSNSFDGEIPTALGDDELNGSIKKYVDSMVDSDQVNFPIDDNDFETNIMSLVRVANFTKEYLSHYVDKYEKEDLPQNIVEEYDKEFPFTKYEEISKPFAQLEPQNKFSALQQLQDVDALSVLEDNYSGQYFSDLWIENGNVFLGFGKGILKIVDGKFIPLYKNKKGKMVPASLKQEGELSFDRKDSPVDKDNIQGILSALIEKSIADENDENFETLKIKGWMKTKENKFLRESLDKSGAFNLFKDFPDEKITFSSFGKSGDGVYLKLGNNITILVENKEIGVFLGDVHGKTTAGLNDEGVVDTSKITSSMLKYSLAKKGIQEMLDMRKEKEKKMAESKQFNALFTSENIDKEKVYDVLKTRGVLEYLELNAIDFTLLEYDEKTNTVLLGFGDQLVLKVKPGGTVFSVQGQTKRKIQFTIGRNAQDELVIGKKNDGSALLQLDELPKIIELEQERKNSGWISKMKRILSPQIKYPFVDDKEKGTDVPLIFETSPNVDNKVKDNS